MKPDKGNSSILFMLPPKKATNILSNYIIGSISKLELLTVFQGIVTEAFEVFEITRTDFEVNDDMNNKTVTSNSNEDDGDATKRVLESPIHNKVKKVKKNE